VVAAQIEDTNKKVLIMPLNGRCWIILTSKKEWVGKIRRKKTSLRRKTVRNT
jgi:hypothetical protein